MLTQASGHKAFKIWKCCQKKIIFDYIHWREGDKVIKWAESNEPLHPTEVDSVTHVSSCSWTTGSQLSCPVTEWVENIGKWFDIQLLYLQVFRLGFMLEKKLFIFFLCFPSFNKQFVMHPFKMRINNPYKDVTNGILCLLAS